MRSWRVDKLFVVLLLVCAVAPAQARDLWLQPEPLTPEPGQEVSVRLMLGDRLAGEERGFESAKAAQFQRVWKKGRENLGGDEGAQPIGRFTPEESGVQVLAYAHRAATGKSDGYYCKAIVVVGEAKVEDPVRWSEVGLRLEIVPQTDPVTLLKKGGRLEVQVLFDREPLAGAAVVAMPQSAPSEGIKSAITDEIGLVTIELDRPGMWMLQVLNKAPDSRSRSTLVLEAGPRR